MFLYSNQPPRCAPDALGPWQTNLSFTATNFVEVVHRPTVTVLAYVSGRAVATPDAPVTGEEVMVTITARSTANSTVGEMLLVQANRTQSGQDAQGTSVGCGGTFVGLQRQPLHKLNVFLSLWDTHRSPVECAGSSFSVSRKKKHLSSGHLFL